MESSSILGGILLVAAVLIAVFYTPLKAFLVGSGIPLLAVVVVLIATALVCAASGIRLLRERKGRSPGSGATPV